MVPEFQEIFTFTITVWDVLANVMVALLCGLFIALLYRYTYRGLNYSSSFTVSLILLTMITAIVIMVIGNNLARAFGMVGAMSIIRFRTAVKDASDIMFIFFALSIGLAAGVKLYSIAIVGTLFVGTVYFVVMKFDLSLPNSREYLIQITAHNPDLPENPFSEIFRSHCRNFKLVNVKTIGDEHSDEIEFSYYLGLKDREKGKTLITRIKEVPGVKYVNLFFDED
ncbi:MAG: DUF4956 domain-containing protein [Bacteroides sp.]|jgi:uncharacterized membrane protein YhiD involved in acid resistance|nr:DUF4956 domain-containing protein [Bacteroides sp.]